MQRQDLLARYPALRAVRPRSERSCAPTWRPSRWSIRVCRCTREQAADLARLAEISETQEVILREIAVRREAADMVFPPLRKTREMQQALAEGQVLMAFFATSHNLYGFLYAHDKYAAWHVQSPTMLQKQIATLLREMGNFDANHEVPPAELAKSNWRAAGSQSLEPAVGTLQRRSGG